VVPSDWTSPVSSEARLRQLRALIAKKNTVEYESRRARAKEAAEAVARATRIVEWAGETVRRAQL
jgi:hypothetical protein